MLISENLPQFADEKTLIIVASTQSADIYIAYESEIEKVSEIRTEKIDHDDQEGHFERRSKGKTLGSGGTYTDESKKLKDRFNNELKEAIDGINTADVTQIILLSSSQDKATTKAQLPTKMQNMITTEIDGNYVGERPNEIIERIQKAQ